MPIKKINRVIKWLDTGIFPASVMFSCGFKYDQIMSHLRKMKDSKDWILGIEADKELIDMGAWFGLSRTIENKKTGEQKHLLYIIITDDFGFTDFEYCKLAHEVLHICQFFLPALLDRNREYEAEAYLHTHLMDQSLRALRNPQQKAQITPG